jgi:hypothetical protein
MVVEDGKRMALYRFADPDRVRRGVTGRKAFPKALKAKMVAKDGEGCGACAAHYEARLLQIDHRIPYGIADAETEANQRVEAFQLLCSSCNRTKSWTCEHGCPNWQVRDPEVCKTCYWFNPSDYLHIATSQRRRITVEWADAQVATFDKLRDDAEKAGMSVPEFVKQRLDRTRV